MRIWTVIKIACALVVAAIVTVSVYFTMHVMGKPVPARLARIFLQLMPEPERLRADHSRDHEKALDLAEMQDIEPGDKAFQDRRGPREAPFPRQLLPRLHRRAHDPPDPR
jgi:hypothetical protein